MVTSDLEYFKILAEKMNFTKAAQALYISQSSLSKSIARLEGRLGFALFERDSHNVTLTPAGSSFYKDVVELLDLYQQAIARARRRSSVKFSSLSVGGHLANPRIYALVEAAQVEMAQLDSSISIVIDPNHAGSVVRRPGLIDPYEDALTGANDLSILYTSSRLAESELILAPLCEEPLCAFVPLLSPLADRKDLALRDLQGYTIITPTTYYTFNWVVEELFSKANVEVTFKSRVVDSMADMLRSRSDSEVFISCKSMLSIAPPEKTSRLKAMLFNDGSSVTLSAAYLPSKKTKPAEQFIDVMHSLIAQCPNRAS